ncbi:UNVERIFIED_CONTAM: hypothetical protein HDU68_007966 [Siphonaria sp. JEL0065]|nr:hypothetical protein HDU68_007966 [Siphonaria sp. JEL0065]
MTVQSEARPIPADEQHDMERLLEALLAQGQNAAQSSSNNNSDVNNTISSCADFAMFPGLDIDMNMDVDLFGSLGVGAGMGDLSSLPNLNLNFMPLSPPVSLRSVLPIQPPLPSAHVQAALASDALAKECLVLLNGPAKKKPGRKKKSESESSGNVSPVAVKLEPSATTHQQPQQQQQLQKQSTESATKKRKTALDDSAQIIQKPLRPLVPFLPSAPQLSSQNVNVSPLPAIDSRRKLSFSATDYLVPTTPSFAPTATSFTPPPLPIPLPPQPNNTSTATTTQLSKHQERMMKNRASADESRRKHKEHVEKLEQMCKDLVAENQLLRSRVLEVEAWAAALSANANAIKSAATSPASVVSDSMVSIPNGSTCVGSADSSDNNLFEMFFGGGDFVFGAGANASVVGSPAALENLKTPKSLTTGGAVFMAFLFSFSMLMFPSSIFERSTAPAVPSAVPHYLPKNSDLVANRRPIIVGLLRYFPSVLFPSTSRNPDAKLALDGLPQLPLLESGFITRDSRGMIVLYTPPIPTHPASRKDSYPEIGGRTPFLTISATEGWGGSNLYNTATTRSFTSTTTASGSICSLDEILALITNTHVYKAPIPPQSSSPKPTKIAKPDATQTMTGPHIQIPKSKLEALQSLFITSPRGNPTTAAVIPPVSQVSRDLVPRGPDSLFVVESRRISKEENVEGGSSVPIEIEEVDTVIPMTPPPPIRDDSDRAAVKRRNMARNKSNPQQPIQIEASELTAVSTTAGSNNGNVDEYCIVKNGPILSIIADLGDDLEMDGEEREGYRLMLDVQVVGAKLVRY